MEEEVKYTLIGFVLLMLCPLLSIPYIIYGIWHRRQGAYFLFSLFLGLMAYLSVPSEDLYRHYYLFSYFAVRPVSSVSWIDISLNGVLPYLYWVMAHTGTPYGLIRLMELTLGFWLLCRVFDWMMNHSNQERSKGEVFARFAILFLFFDFMYTTMGVKFGFALCTYIYSLHLILNKGRKLPGLLWLVLTCCWHSSFIFTGLFVYAIYRFNPSRKTALWICGLLAIVAPIVIGIAGEALLGRRFEFYFSKRADDVASYGAMTTTGLVFYILPKLTVIPFAVLLLKHYDTEQKWCRVALGWLILAIALMSNAVTFYRFWWAFMATGVIMFLELEWRVVFSKRVVGALVVCGCLFTALNTLTYHSEVMHSPYYKAFAPAPVILSQDYDKQWVYSHIKHNGRIRK